MVGHEQYSAQGVALFAEFFVISTNEEDFCFFVSCQFPSYLLQLLNFGISLTDLHISFNVLWGQKQKIEIKALVGMYWTSLNHLKN